MVPGPVDSSIDSRINYKSNLVPVMLVHKEGMVGRKKFVFDLKRLFAWTLDSIADNLLRF